MGEMISGREGEDRLAAGLFLDRIRGQIRRGVNSGKHYYDAANEAGLSANLATVLRQNSSEMAELYEVSKDRPREILVLEGDVEPPPKTPAEIKHRYLKDLSDAGLFRKSVAMVKAADPEDEQGARIIEGHLRFVVKDLWPRESQSETYKAEEPVETATEEELERRLELARKRRLAMQANVTSAKKALEERAGGQSETA
jgi:hypothetical protein